MGKRSGAKFNDEPKKRKKKGSKVFKFFRYMFIYMIIGTLITVPTLMYIDKFIYNLSQSSINGNIVDPNSNKNNATLTNALNIKIDEEAESVQYSYDNKYYTYLKDSKIYVNDLETGENLTIIEDESPICYFNLLYDKNLLMYFTEYEGRYASTLTLYTYDLDTERTNEFNTFTVYNFSRIKDMSMSPIINIIYINVETQTQYSTNNVIYKIDLFNNMSQVRSGLIVEEMLMLQHKDRVYYEDTKYNIYSGGYYYLDIFDEDVQMIGIDQDDNLYFLSTDPKDTVYVVKDNEVIDIIELSDSDVVTTYTNYEGVYVIYPTYILNVAGENPYKRIGKLSKYVTFEAVKDNIMYLRTTENQLIRTELLEN